MKTEKAVVRRLLPVEKAVVRRLLPVVDGRKAVLYELAIRAVLYELRYMMRLAWQHVTGNPYEQKLLL